MPHEVRRVLVTGGGSGIGRALVVEGARRGMRVALCGRRPAALAETAAALPSGADPLLITADLSNAADRARVVSTLAESWGRLDVLINNAGVVAGGSAHSLTDAALEEIILTNVLAPIALTRDLAPLLAAARLSRVVNIGSMFGDIAYPGFAAYSASKFALRGFSSALRREWKPLGIGVTYAAPRATRTAAAAAFRDLIEQTGMRLDDAAGVATAVWQAVEAGHDHVYPPGLERLFVFIQNLAPKLIDRSFARKAVNAGAQVERTNP
jgi:short-subunit dehydrogenase